MNRSLNNRLTQLETENGDMQIAMLLPIDTGLNDGTRTFRWAVDGKAFGDIITVDAHRDEEQGESRLTGQAIWSETRQHLPPNTTALTYRAHQV